MENKISAEEFTSKISEVRLHSDNLNEILHSLTDETQIPEIELAFRKAEVLDTALKLSRAGGKAKAIAMLSQYFTEQIMRSNNSKTSSPGVDSTT